MKPFCRCVEHGERDIEGALERDVNKHRQRKKERDTEEKGERLNVFSNEKDKT